METLRIEGGDDPLDPKGAVELARSGRLKTVESLELPDQSIGDVGLAAILDAIDPRRLVCLELAGSHFDEEGPRLLSRARHLDGLQYLGVAFNSFRPSVLRDLVTAPQWASLEELNLSMNYVDASVCEAIGTRSHLSHLRMLTINGTLTLGDEAVAHLASAAKLRRLEDLSLAWNRITDEGAFALAESSELVSLRRLTLEGNYLSLRGVKALQGCSTLKELTVEASDFLPPELPETVRRFLANDAKLDE